LVGALTVVCSQRLVRTVCISCGGRGDCDACSDAGYLGRTACGQIAVMDERVRRAVLDRRPASELRGIIAEAWPDLAADARRLVSEGRTTEDEVLRVLGTMDTLSGSSPVSKSATFTHEELPCRGLNTKV